MPAHERLAELVTHLGLLLVVAPGLAETQGFVVMGDAVFVSPQWADWAESALRRMTSTSVEISRSLGASRLPFSEAQKAKIVSRLRRLSHKK